MGETLRVSSYELIYALSEDTGHALAVNGLCGAYDIVQASEGDVLRRAQKTPAVLRALPEDTLVRLIRRGHVVSFTEQEERENARLISRMYWLLPYQTQLDLVMLPSYNCNFRCEYCFERKRLERGSAWLSRIMSPETVAAVFSQVEAYRQQNVKTRACFLYGGEPLLNSNRAVLEDICERCDALKIPLYCVTNGYELDTYLDMICKYRFSFLQVTVDGVGAVHDQRRYLAGHQGSYNRIMQNVGLALERGITIDLRVNINRANLGGIPALYEEFKRRGFLSSPGFHYYFKATIACFEDDPQNAITDAELFEELCSCGICSAADMSHSRVFADMASRVGRALKGDSYAPLSPAHCGAESSMLVVDPEGVLYTCWDVVSMEDHAVGLTDVQKGRFLFNFDFPKWRTRTADRMESCADCPYLMNCGGGCAIESENTFGDMRRGFCGSVRQAFDYAAPVICGRRFAQTGEPELSLSLFDLLGGISAKERETLLHTTSQKEAYAILQKYLKTGIRMFG